MASGEVKLSLIYTAGHGRGTFCILDVNLNFRKNDMFVYIRWELRAFFLVIKEHFLVYLGYVDFDLVINSCTANPYISKYRSIQKCFVVNGGWANNPPLTDLNASYYWEYYISFNLFHFFSANINSVLLRRAWNVICVLLKHASLVYPLWSTKWKCAHLAPVSRICTLQWRHNELIITSLTIVYSTVYSGTD